MGCCSVEKTNLRVSSPSVIKPAAKEVSEGILKSDNDDSVKKEVRFSDSVSFVADNEKKEEKEEASKKEEDDQNIESQNPDKFEKEYYKSGKLIKAVRKNDKIFFRRDNVTKAFVSINKISDSEVCTKTITVEFNGKEGINVKAMVRGCEKDGGFLIKEGVRDYDSDFDIKLEMSEEMKKKFWHIKWFLAK